MAHGLISDSTPERSTPAPRRSRRRRPARPTPACAGGSSAGTWRADAVGRRSISRAIRTAGERWRWCSPAPAGDQAQVGDRRAGGRARRGTTSACASTPWALWATPAVGFGPGQPPAAAAAARPRRDTYLDAFRTMAFDGRVPLSIPIRARRRASAPTATDLQERIRLGFRSQIGAEVEHAPDDRRLGLLQSSLKITDLTLGNPARRVPRRQPGDRRRRP